MIKVAIMDESVLIRASIRQILSEDNSIEVVGDVLDISDIKKLLTIQKIDILLLDISKPGNAGVSLLKEINIRIKGLKILVLSMHNEYQFLAASLKDGALGYLMKSDLSAELIDAVYKASEGSIYISQFFLKKFKKKIKQ
ncbi:MAG: response regulator transcription factor [Bacteroidota bacterium]|nr:response regulator transcription factor [Bacteroidota bacterium]